MTLLSKHEKRDSRRLPISANLSESLILSLFLYFFTCSVTVDIPSPHAILKERSPSCGFGKIYDGSFTGTLTDGNGITAQLLYEHGITILGESRIDKLDIYK